MFHVRQVGKDGQQLRNLADNGCTDDGGQQVRVRGQLDISHQQVEQQQIEAGRSCISGGRISADSQSRRVSC